RADWLGLRRPLSPGDPHHADPDPPCPLLRAPERAASRRADRSPLRWHGSVLVGVVVRRLEGRVLEGRDPAAGDAHGGGGGNLAVAGGVEALHVRSALDHRGPAGGPAVTRRLPIRRARCNMCPALTSGDRGAVIERGATSPSNRRWPMAGAVPRGSSATR